MDRELTALVLTLIGSKFEETDVTCVRLEKLRSEAVGRYSREVIVEHENVVLEALEWEVCLVTPYHFLRGFMETSWVFESDDFVKDELSLREKYEVVFDKAVGYLDRVMRNFEF